MIEIILYYAPVVPVTFALILNSNIFKPPNKRYLNVLTLLCAIYYGFFFGFRSLGSGTDTVYYAQSFGYINTVDLYWEPAFSAFAQLISIFTDSGQLFLVATSLLMCVLFGFASSIIAEYSKVNPLVLFFLLVLNFSYFDLITNGIRQGISIAVILLGYALISSGGSKSLYGYLAIFCAPLFHTSAAILAFIVFVTRLNSNTHNFSMGKFLFLFVVGVFIYTQIDSIIDIAIGHLDDLFIVRKVFNSIAYYREESLGSFSSLNALGKVSIVISLLFPMLMTIISKFFCKKSYYKISDLLFVYAFTVVIYAIFANNAFSYRYIYLGAFFGILIIYINLRNIGYSFGGKNEKIVDFIALAMSFSLSIIFVWASKQASNFSLGI